MITGAGSGLGRLAALELAAKGHLVIATTETNEQADELRGSAPQLQVEKLDVTTQDVELVAKWEVDVLIDNAGAGQSGPLVDMPSERVRHLFEVNVFGTLNVTRAVVKQMIARGRGRIIIMSSVGGVIVAPAFGAYSMTKYALEAMGRALRLELAPFGIDVTLINPSGHLTGFNDRMANSMWEWFDSASLTGAQADMYKGISDSLTSTQRDPIDVARRLVELVEADSTTINNFVPANILEQRGLA